MATAEIKTVITVTLTLTMAEAQVLSDVTRRIGGHPDTTRRGLTDAIGEALRKAGVQGLNPPGGGDTDIEQGLRFRCEGGY